MSRRLGLIHKRKKAVTLIELLVATAILGIVFMLTKFGGDMLKQMAQERTFVDAQRQAELAMYRIKIDVVSSRNIFLINSNTLSMSMYNFHKGYDVGISTSLFSEVNMGTVTYQYSTSGQKTFVQRTAIFPNFPPSTENFLTNILVSTETTTLDGQPFDPKIFAPGHQGLPLPPYESVQVFFNLLLPYGQTLKKYHQEFSKRNVSN